MCFMTVLGAVEAVRGEMFSLSVGIVITLKMIFFSFWIFSVYVKLHNANFQNTPIFIVYAAMAPERIRPLGIDFFSSAAFEGTQL